MGTTLTGTTPQDTYDSLIKVTDNGPLSGTAKYLSDGLGNDSVLALSTARVGIGTNTPNSTFKVTVNSGTNINSFLNGDKLSFSRSSDNSADVVYLSRTNDLGANGTANIQGYDGIQFRTLGPEGVKMTITDAGNVGIGTSTASRLLTLKNNAGATNGISFQSLASTSEIAAIECNQTLDTIDFEMYSAFAGNGFRFLTGSPTPVERARFTANGLTFNGDTAAANALDDYEEGDWTPSVAFGGGSTGITYSFNSGNYTKIGRQVTVTGLCVLTSKGSDTGSATITGLPFTISNSDRNYSAVTLQLNKISFANQFQAYGSINTTRIDLTEITEGGVNTTLTDANFANDSDFIISFTYFV